jgi:hypothetical protein
MLQTLTRLKLMNKPYQLVDDQWVKLIDGPYSGIMYKYGRVNLVEEGEHLRIQFEYELDTGERLDSNFVQYIGPILVDLIEEGIINNNIVYTGGTDAP